MTCNGVLGLTMPSSHKFKIFADYFQFVLVDETSDDDFSEIWGKTALDRMLAVGDKALCPGTLRNIDVDVQINIVEKMPVIEHNDFDHIAEASIDIPSGKLIVMGCTGYLPDAPRIEVNPGIYQALFLVSGVKSIAVESEPAEDIYVVYLWPGQQREPGLVKHWKRNAAGRSGDVRQ